MNRSKVGLTFVVLVAILAACGGDPDAAEDDGGNGRGGDGGGDAGAGGGGPVTDCERGCDQLESCLPDGAGPTCVVDCEADLAGGVIDVGCVVCFGDADCADITAGGCDSSCAPHLVSISLIGVAIGPGTSDGAEWDGAGEVDQAVWDGLATALAAVNPVAAVVAFLGQPAMDAISAPDPFGTANIAVDGIYSPATALQIAVEQDAFQPTWTDVGWYDVPLSQNLRIRVDLTDEDLSNHDSVGIVELNYDDVIEALNARQVVQVVVADQAPNPTRPQVLLLGLSVMEQR